MRALMVAVISADAGDARDGEPVRPDAICNHLRRARVDNTVHHQRLDEAEALACACGAASNIAKAMNQGNIGNVSLTPSMKPARDQLGRCDV